jgi:hypothetical protein
MYGRLSQLHGHVHGDHDAVHEDGQDGHEDDGHVHGLLGDVPDVRQLHYAHVSDVREDVPDVRRNLHDVRGNVRRNAGQSHHDALRGDVPPVRRVLLDDCEVDEGRLANGDAVEARGQRTLPPYLFVEARPFRHELSAKS